MNREELYYKTVDVLLDAYNSGELFSQSCEACAVGNICIEASELTGVPRGKWTKLFSTGRIGVQEEYRSKKEGGRLVVAFFFWFTSCSLPLALLKRELELDI